MDVKIQLDKDNDFNLTSLVPLRLRVSFRGDLVKRIVQHFGKYAAE